MITSAPRNVKQHPNFPALLPLMTALALLGFGLYNERYPFDGETTVVVAVKHLQEEMVSPRVYASDVPVSLEQIILKCTEKSPDRRYSNIAELIADLKQAIEQA